MATLCSSFNPLHVVLCWLTILSHHTCLRTQACKYEGADDFVVSLRLLEGCVVCVRAFVRSFVRSFMCMFSYAAIAKARSALPSLLLVPPLRPCQFSQLPPALTLDAQSSQLGLKKWRNLIWQVFSYVMRNLWK